MTASVGTILLRLLLSEKVAVLHRTTLPAALDFGDLDGPSGVYHAGRDDLVHALLLAAVEEQGAATQEIARNVQQAAQGTTQVASNILEFQRGSTETGQASARVLNSAGSLSVESARKAKYHCKQIEPGIQEIP